MNDPQIPATTTPEGSAHDRAPGSAPDRAPGYAVVAIGASRRGLAALRSVLAALPKDSGEGCGIAWLLALQTRPERRPETDWVALLQPHCPLPVERVAGTVEVRPGRVYPVPPGTRLSAAGDGLRLNAPPPAPAPSQVDPAPEPTPEPMPIDRLFRALAQAWDGQAIGVLLAGTGADGALGLAWIREHGGLALRQDPGEGESGDEAPRPADASDASAQDVGAADRVLPLGRIVPEVVRLARRGHRGMPPGRLGAAAGADERRVLERLLALLHAHTGRDVGLYKRSLLLHRIARRMRLLGIGTLGDYLDALGKRPEEAETLVEEIPANLSEPLGEGELLTLAQEAIPRLFGDRADGKEQVRAWSVGCSGEEAYALAALLLEEARRRHRRPKLQVFASDLHERTLAQARRGVFPAEGLLQRLGPERIARYFTLEDDRLRARRELRDILVFASHDLLRDPPFSHLDLVVCRNLLGKLRLEARQGILELFHFALTPGGLLLLGPDDSSDRDDLFQSAAPDTALYRRRRLPFARAPLPDSLGRALKRRAAAASGDPEGYAAVHKRMQEGYAPPSVLIDGDCQVVHASPSAGRYLRLPGGAPTADLFKLLPEGLGGELKVALAAVRHSRHSARSRPVAVEIEGEPRRVALQVSRAASREADGLCLVVFDEIVADSPLAAVGELAAGIEATEQRLRAAAKPEAPIDEPLGQTQAEMRAIANDLARFRRKLEAVHESVTWLDVQSRQRIEELAQLSGDLSLLLESTGVATLFLDPGLRILSFTPQVTDVIPVRDRDRGRPLGDLVHRLHYPGLQDDARRVLELGLPVEHEVASEDGRWYLTRVLPYRDRDERIQGVVLTLVDITDRKHAEDALREAGRRKDQFLATLGHELRNPLAAMVTALEVQRLIETSQEALRLRDMLERQTRHLVRLVDDLLDVSRITRGKIELRRERIDLARPVREAAEANRDWIRQHGHRLELVLPDETLTVEADPVRLAQVFANLLSNAAKFTGDGGHIRIALARDGDRAVVSVRDDGIGMDAQLLPRVFDLFVQAHPSGTGAMHGLGIGLTLVRSLIELHGGSVEARSDGPGQGSEMLVRLPLVPDRPEVEEAAAQAPPIETQSAGAQRLLVVDDNRDAADAVRLLLETLGTEVRVAYDGPTALSLFETWHPTVVLADLGMPGMDGFEVARRLRAACPDGPFRLIALSGWGQREHRARSRAAGFDLHLTKPVTIRDLKTALSG